MARLPQPGGDAGQWGEILNDYLSQSHGDDGALKSDTVGAAQLKSNSVEGAAIVDQTISEQKLSSAVQSKLNDSAVADGSITAAKLADGSVTDAAIAADAAIAQTKISGLSTALAAKADNSAVAGKADDAAVVHLAGSEVIAGDKNFTGELTQDGNAVVDSSDARLTDHRTPTDGSVTTAKLADGAVTNVKLQGAGLANGVATLDSAAKVPESQLPARLAPDELSSTYAPLAAVIPRPGVKAAFLGDSITNGSNAAAGRRWVDQLPAILGTQVVSAASVELGNPGERADQMLARWDADIKDQGFGVIFLLAGTNDSGQGATLAQFSGAIKGIASKARAEGIPLIIGTIPPMGDGTSAAITNRVALFNFWLESWAPGAGVLLANVFGQLSNQGGSLQSGYNSDGIHPETLGHQKIAEAFADAFTAAFPTRATSFHPLSSSLLSDNKVTNPYFLNDSATGWYEQPGGTGAAPVYSYEADSTQIRLGKWRVIDADGTAGAGTRYYCTTLGPVTAGERYLVTARMTYEDVTGSFYNASQGAGPGSDFGLRVMDSGFVPRASLLSRAVRKPGPIARVFTVPAGMTGAILVFQVTTTAAIRTKFKLGEVGFIRVDNKPEIEELI